MIKITATDTASPYLAGLLRRLKNRAALHGAIAEEAEDLFRRHIGGQARIRHRTAQALGADPTGELEKAAQSPEGTATDAGARITLRPGYLFARAFRDVEIKPTGGKKYLTIPVAAESYGRRASEFKSLRFYRPGNKNMMVASRPRPGSAAETMFILVPRVRQKQDRSLLPSDKGILDAAEVAATKYLADDKNDIGGIA